MTESAFFYCGLIYVASSCSNVGGAAIGGVADGGDGDVLGGAVVAGGGGEGRSGDLRRAASALALLGADGVEGAVFSTRLSILTIRALSVRLAATLTAAV